MQLDLDVVNTNIRTLIATLLALDPNQVRPANQSAPTGLATDHFITVLTNEIEGEGWDSVTLVDQGVPDTLTENISGWRNVSASVQFFRKPAKTNAGRMKGLLQSTSGKRLMNQLGLGLQSFGKVVDLSQVVDAAYEERAQVQFEFQVSSVEQPDLSTLLSVPVSIITDYNVLDTVTPPAGLPVTGRPQITWKTPIGPQGPQGIPGTNGTNGTNGAQGIPGPPGTQVNPDWSASSGVAQILNKPTNLCTVAQAVALAIAL